MAKVRGISDVIGRRAGWSGVLGRFRCFGRCSCLTVSKHAVIIDAPAEERTACRNQENAVKSHAGDRTSGVPGGYWLGYR